MIAKTSHLELGIEVLQQLTFFSLCNPLQGQRRAGLIKSKTRSIERPRKKEETPGKMAPDWLSLSSTALVQQLWKTVQLFLKKLGLVLPTIQEFLFCI